MPLCIFLKCNLTKFILSTQFGLKKEKERGRKGGRERERERGREGEREREGGRERERVRERNAIKLECRIRILEGSNMMIISLETQLRAFYFKIS